jgi:hypothetical protein
MEAMHDLRKVMQTCSTLCARGLRLKLLSKAETELTVNSDPILFFVTWYVVGDDRRALLEKMILE